MLDRFFAPLLTFATLIAGTIGFASALATYTPRNDEVLLAQGMPPEVVMLERVEIVARREQPTAQVAADTTKKATPAPESRGVRLLRARD
ncbi:MAG TPA: hypothetical protein VFL64_06095 [Rhizobacter sp.]|nr:hypothetical protein [Rhizobacter sp.]